MTSWACDFILSAVDAQGKPVLLATPQIDRREDVRLPTLLSQHGAIKVEQAEIPFEGGNILIGEEHIFVGADSPAIAELDLDKRETVLIGAFNCPAETLLPAMRGTDEWQEIFHFHNKAGTRQPVFHIDMFMTLAGKGADGRERILVGDPAMAAEILGTPLHPFALAQHFDAIASDLTARGFAVIRNPLPMIYMDSVEECRRIWIYASSNNVLVQKIAEKVNAVWVAQYGHNHWPELSKTDACNAEIWEILEFEVLTIPDGQKLAENLGGLHCLTNVLRRGCLLFRGK